jgi:hypothetical protein
MTVSSRSRLGCEQLEARENPSNVSVVYNSTHDLIITGDNAGNIFTLQENAAGDYFVQAGSGTTINGLPAVNLGAIKPVIISITGGNGNDNIAVYGVHPSNTLAITTGSGNDYVNLSGDVTKYVNVNVAAGNNTLTTTNVTASVSATIKAGTGDNVWVDNSLHAASLKQSGWTKIEP